MTSATRPIILGLGYQARWFWIEAARLLRSEPVLTSVGFELGRYGRAFDDVISIPIRPDLNAWGQFVDVDCYQAKFKVDHRQQITAASIMDPAFINATKFSMLQRLALAQATTAKAGLRGRYTVVTPWRADRNDILASLTTTNGELNLDRLFDGGPGSAPGKVREAWRSHIGLASDEDLRPVLESFRLVEYGPDALDRTLESALDSVGLTTVPPGSLGHRYVDLAHGFVKTRQRQFDAAALRRILDAEGLWRPTGAPALPGRPLAIRSRRPFAAHLEDEDQQLLDLVPMFHARDIRTGIDWNADVAPAVVAFLEARIEPGATYRLHLDAHNAIAFAAGWHLTHSGAEVIPMQRTMSVVVPWPSAGAPPDGPLWAPWEQDMPSAGADIALALGVTHDVRADVEAYVSAHLPSVGRVIGLTAPHPGTTAVRDGAHAFALARAAIEHVTAGRKPDERGARVHLFAAAPNSLIFFLGRVARGLGPTTVYEFDFDTRALGSYVPAISLPPSH